MNDQTLVWLAQTGASAGTLFNMRYDPEAFPGTPGPPGPPGPPGSGGGATSFTPPFGPVHPTTATASSSARPSDSQPPFDVLNLLEPGEDKYWLSEIDTTNPESVTLHFSSQVYPTAITLWFSNGRFGANTRIQGSADNSTWTTLHTVEPSNATLVDTVCVYSAPLAVTTGPYRYIRVISDPSPYMHYHYIQVFGATRIPP